jgi:ABC-type amino acid transport substrate-binding protein
MHFHHSDADPLAACAALRTSRARLCARVAALQAQPDDVFVQDFPAVVAAVEADFRREEALLERLGDAALHPRRADFAVLLCALHRTLPRIEGGDVDLGRQVADALGAVLSLPWDAGTDAATAAATRPAPPPGPRPARVPAHLH